MNQAITIELQFFLISVLSGGILLFVYDILRIIRRLVNHDSFFVALEDLIFWVCASLFIFAMMYKENDGIIRGFSIMGMGIGMILYHNIVDEMFVNLIVKLIRTLISPFVFVINKIKGIIRLIWNKCKKVVNFITRQLKKRMKSVKITLDKRKQASSVKKQKHLDEKMSKKQEVTKKSNEAKAIKLEAKKKKQEAVENKRKAKERKQDQLQQTKENQPPHSKKKQSGSKHTKEEQSKVKKTGRKLDKRNIDK